MWSRNDDPDLKWDLRSQSLQPGRQGSLGENGDTCMYGWVPALFAWNYHSIVCSSAISSVQSHSRVWLCNPMDWLPCPSPTPGACSNSCPSSQWCHPTTSSSVMPFSSHLRSFPASGCFPVSQFASGGQSIGVSAPVSVLPVNTQDWFPLGLTGWISLQSKRLGYTPIYITSDTTIQNKKPKLETSLVVQWLRPQASTAGVTGSIPGRTPHCSRVNHTTQHGAEL